MFDLKISGITAAGAFLLSFLLGLLSGAALAVILLRALVFALIFFVLSAAGYYLITRFLPELLDNAGGGRRDGDLSGSMVNITLDDPPASPASPAVMSGEDSPAGGELGDISAFMEGSPLEDSPGPEDGGNAPGGEERGDPPPPPDSPAGLDQGSQNGYIEKGGEANSLFEDFLPLSMVKNAAPAAVSKAAPAAAEVPGADDFLPDLDAMAGAFNANGEGEEASAGMPAGRRASPGSKGSKMEGDFNPKDLAAAIRDRLKRE